MPTHSVLTSLFGTTISCVQVAKRTVILEDTHTIEGFVSPCFLLELIPTLTRWEACQFCDWINDLVAGDFVNRTLFFDFEQMIPRNGQILS